MTRVLSVLNQKGGVGKTTVAVNLAEAAAHLGASVLVIDCDPQANATDALRGADPDFNINDLYGDTEDVEEGAADEAIVPSGWTGIDLLHGTEDLAAREVQTNTEVKLRWATSGALDAYDLVLIDCPPSLGRLAMSALIASTDLLLVAEPSAASIKGVDRALHTVRLVQRLYSRPDLGVAGVVINRVRPTNESRARRDEILDRFGSEVLAVLPERTSVQAAYAARTPLRATGDPAALEVSDLLEGLAKRLLPHLAPIPTQPVEVA